MNVVDPRRAYSTRRGDNVELVVQDSEGPPAPRREEVGPIKIVVVVVVLLLLLFLLFRACNAQALYASITCLL